MQIIVSSIKKKEIIDITEIINEEIVQSRKQEGVCVLFIRHTTAALTTADLDPGTDDDMLDAFEAIMPKLHYRHPHNPEHAPDHILSSLIGPSVVIPFRDGELDLGTWQRVVLVELDGPRPRNISLTFL